MKHEVLLIVIIKIIGTCIIFTFICCLTSNCFQKPYFCFIDSNKLQDQIFWYKAGTHRDLRLGSKEFWAISKDLGSDDEDEQYDPQGGRKKGAGQRISVKKPRR